MNVMLYLSFLLISATPAFLYAAPPSEFDFRPAPPKFDFRPQCNPNYVSNEVLQALLDPLYYESSRGFCSAYISAPFVTATVTAKKVINSTHHLFCSLLSSLCPLFLNAVSYYIIPLCIMFPCRQHAARRPTFSKTVLFLFLGDNVVAE